MQKLVIVDKEENIILDVIENILDLKIEDTGENGLNVEWQDGQLLGLQADLIVLDGEAFPDLKEQPREGERTRKKAPSNLRNEDKKENFKKTDIQTQFNEFTKNVLEPMQAQIDELKRQLSAEKQSASGKPAQ